MIRYLLALLALITLISCSDDTTDSTESGNGKVPGNDQTVPVAQGEMIPGSVIKSGEYIFKSSEDTLVFSIEAKAGKSYHVSLHYFNVPTQKVILSPAGDSLNSPFVSTQSGSHTVKIFTRSGAGENETASVEYSVKELNSTAPLNGIWLLSEESYTTSVHSDTKRYSEESADIVMEIRNDSIFYNTYYNIMNNQISGEPYLASLFPNMKYEVSENNLTLEQNNAYGYLKYSYSRFTGDIADIVWADELFEVQEEALGSWYLASETYNSVEFDKGVRTEDPETRRFSSAGSSRLIYEITKDECIEYVNEFSEDFLHPGYASSKSWFFRNCRREGDNLIFERSNLIFYGDEQSYVDYEKQVFTKYEGELFPPEWSEITVPATVTPLEIGREISTTVNDRDTIWYEVDLEEGYYQFNHSFDHEDYQIRAYVINQSTMEPKRLVSYERVEAGTYYLVLMPTIYRDESAAVTYSLKSL